jgi:hypothetical protein
VAADGAPRARRDAAAIPKEAIVMGAFWTLVTYLFTFGVLALVGFGFWHLYTTARDNSPRLRH